MIRLDLEVDSTLVEFSWNLVQEVLGNLRQEPDERFIPADADDPDFAEAWMDGLREALDRDFQAITNLFTANRFGEEPVELKPEDAEGIIRACSAVRLWLRNHRLEDVPDPSLETGVVDLEALKPEPRLAYFTYGLLAYLQESLIELLDVA